MNRILEALTPGDRALVADHLEDITLKKGDVLAEIDEPMSHFFFMRRGLVCLMTSVLNGKTVSTGLIGFNMFVGASCLLTTDNAVSNYVVQLPGEAWRIPREELRGAIRRSPTLHDLFRRFCHFSLRMNHHDTACNRLHLAPQRLSRFLLAAREATGSDEIPMSQAEFSYVIGTTPKIIGPILRDLTRAGMISRARGMVKLLDHDALKDASCECHQQSIDWLDEVFSGK